MRNLHLNDFLMSYSLYYFRRNVYLKQIRTQI